MKTFVCLALVGILATTASARFQSVGESVAGLKTAIDNRLAAIGTPAPKDLKKEAGFLGKARKSLNKWLGEADKKGLKAASKAAGLVEKANSADAGVNGWLQNLLGSLGQHADQKKAGAESVKGDLKNPKNIAKINKQLTKFAGIASSARGSAKLLVKAILGFLKATTKAEKLLAKEIKKGGGTGSLTIGADGMISSADGFTLKDIEYNLKITFQGNTTKVKGKLSDTGFQPVVVPGGVPFNGTTLLPIPAKIPGFPLTIKGTFTYITDKGSLKFTFS